MSDHSDAITIGRRRGSELARLSRTPDDTGFPSPTFVRRVLIMHAEAVADDSTDTWCRMYSNAYLQGYGNSNA